mgnify:FL=1
MSNEDIDAIKRVRSRKGEIDALALETAKHEIERLTADAPNRLKTYTRERETIDHMDRIYRTCRSIAGSAPTKEELELQPEETTT